MSGTVLGEEIELETAPQGQRTCQAQTGGQSPRVRRPRSVHASIEQNATLSPAYLIMNSLSAVVATYGLLQDSTAVVIGAMIIALLLGPISGMALGLVLADNRLLVRALGAEVTGAVLVFSISFVLGKFYPTIPFKQEIMARTAPNILDLVIALAAGAAGAYATVSPRVSAGLVGVAIATALVPPLCTSALCVSRGHYHAGGGAFLLFLTNLIAIQSVTSLVLWLHGFRPHTHRHGWALVRRFAPTGLMLTALAVFLGVSFHKALAREALRVEVKKLLQDRIERTGAASLVEVSLQPGESGTEITALVRAPWVIVPESCARLEDTLRHSLERDDLTLHVRTVVTRECDDKRFLWDDLSSGNSLGEK